MHKTWKPRLLTSSTNRKFSQWTPNPCLSFQERPMSIEVDQSHRFIERTPGQTHANILPLPKTVKLIPNFINEQLEHQLADELRLALQNGLTSPLHPDFKRKMCNIYPERLIQKTIPKCYELMKQVHQQGLISSVPDALQINYYLPEGGCPMHVDAPSIGPVVAMFSFLSPCVMELNHEPSSTKYDILLEPRSLLLLADEARNEWEHGVHPGLVHHFAGKEVVKNHRMSLVFWKQTAPKLSGRGSRIVAE